MDFADYNIILQQRETALRTRMYIPSGQDFVPAFLRVDGDRIPVEMRLMEGPATYLGDDEKWGFEIRPRDDHRILGMRRCYLQDPATNNGLNQWAFSQVLQEPLMVF